MLHPALLLGASLLLSGCLSPGEARLPGGTYRLQPASSALRMDAWEEIEFQYPDRKGRFLIHVLNTEDKTRLTILDPASMATLLSCTYSDGKLERAGIIPAREIPDELPLALLQISAWPEEAVRSGLTGELRLQRTLGRRILSDAGSAIAVIEEHSEDNRTILLPRFEVTISVRKATQP